MLPSKIFLPLLCVNIYFYNKSRPGRRTRFHNRQQLTTRISCRGWQYAYPAAASITCAGPRLSVSKAASSGAEVEMALSITCIHIRVPRAGTHFPCKANEICTHRITKILPRGSSTNIFHFFFFSLSRAAASHLSSF